MGFYESRIRSSRGPYHMLVLGCIHVARTLLPRTTLFLFIIPIVYKARVVVDSSVNCIRASFFSEAFYESTAIVACEALPQAHCHYLMAEASSLRIGTTHAS